MYRVYTALIPVMFKLKYKKTGTLCIYFFFLALE